MNTEKWKPCFENNKDTNLSRCVADPGVSMLVERTVCYNFVKPPT